MGDTSHSPQPVRFGVFEVDLRSGELRKHGLKIKLQEQPFQILTMLLERPGEVVTREELQKRLWPEDTFVDFDNSLNTGINKIREALGDSADNPRFVETLPRRGYRFIYPVETVAALYERRLLEEKKPPAVIDRRYSYARFAGLVAGAIIAVLALLLALNVGGLRERLLTAVGARRAVPLQEIKSIAVLPLENLSGDPEQEYFADAMTEELITNLGKISALRVISRTSAMHYKGTKKRLPEIAKELNVDAIVEGTVQRSGGRVRITANLLHAPTDRHLWAESYERNLRDVLALQSEVAQAITREIRITVTPDEHARLARVRSVDPKAHEAYLRGRYFWNKRGPENFNIARRYFQQALEIDPEYALAYAGLADCYLGYSKTQAVALKALELDPTLAEPHATLGLQRWFDDWDWSGAEREFKQALELNPGYAMGRSWYATYLAAMGRTDEALAEMKRALEIDPLSLVANADFGWVYYCARRYDEAIKQYRKTLELEPNFHHTGQYEMGYAYREKGMYKEAVAVYQRALELNIRDPRLPALLGHTYAVWGKQREALKLLEEVKQLSGERGVPAYEVAVIHLGLGEKDKALAGLEKAFREHHPDMLFLKVEPIFDPLRSDPRFQDLLRRMKFPE